MFASNAADCGGESLLGVMLGAGSAAELTYGVAIARANVSGLVFGRKRLE